MPIPTDYTKIIDALTANTEAGRLEWKDDSFGYESSINDSRFTTWSGTDQETEVPFVAFALMDEKRNILDSWFVEPEDDDYETMRLFHAMAKRHGLRIPARLSRITKALEDMGRNIKE